MTIAHLSGWAELRPVRGVVLCQHLQWVVPCDQAAIVKDDKHSIGVTASPSAGERR